jgi:flagellar biosynthesis/type III secretory pathway protein FliH
MNMILTEWNIDDAKAIWREEGREEGWEEGREKGREEGREKGREEILYLVERGYTAEQIKEFLASPSPLGISG